jgi:hypothetical protein
MAETYRRARRVAEELNVPRPSYERARQHIHEVRRAKRKRRKKQDLVRDVAFRVRPVDALSELMGDP